jgi:hypothetical protein
MNHHQRSPDTCWHPGYSEGDERTRTAGGGFADPWLNHLPTSPGNRPGRRERETGFEPATPCLGSRCSTTELLPRNARQPCDFSLAQPSDFRKPFLGRAPGATCRPPDGIIGKEPADLEAPACIGQASSSASQGAASPRASGAASMRSCSSLIVRPTTQALASDSAPC